MHSSPTPASPPERCSIILPTLIIIGILAIVLYIFFSQPRTSQSNDSIPATNHSG